MNIRDFRELRVYGGSVEAAMEIFRFTRALPADERYALGDQIRRSSRAVCANIAEAWRRRRYPGNFVLRLVDAAAEADETKVWLEFAGRCGYLDASTASGLESRYDTIIGQLVRMYSAPEAWTVRPPRQDQTAPRVAASPRPRVRE